MYTSATEAGKTAFVYAAVTAAVAGFGGVYEIFSHGVWSAWMVYAFAFPLVLGLLPNAWRAMVGRALPCRWAMRLHHAGVATFTVGSIMQGVMAIYGTTNRLILVYWVVGTLLIAGGLLMRAFRKQAVS